MNIYKIISSVLVFFFCSTDLLAEEKRYFSKSTAMRLIDSYEQYDNLVIKFTESSGIRLTESQLNSIYDIRGKELREMNNLNRWLNHNRVQIRPLFEHSPEKIDEMRVIAERNSNKNLADLNSYVSINLRKQPEANITEMLLFLNSFNVVEVAYVEAPTAINRRVQLKDLGFANPGITPLFVNHQQYFAAAPVGVGLFDAWSNPGGRGNGVKVIVYDGNYRDTHEDLPDLFYTTGHSEMISESHGTAVLGIVGAKNNGLGLTGGVTNALIGFQRVANAAQSHASKLLTAADNLDNGDVLVSVMARTVGSLGFECPCNPTQANTVPLEFYPAEFDAIQMITSLGISFVQSAGNGCVDFDSPAHQDSFTSINNDSGSIIVGASSHDLRGPTCYSNYGQQVDMHAWGESVSALFFVRDDEIPLYENGLDRRYGSNFGGTSSAAPIVAACVASLQAQAINDEFGFVNYANVLSPSDVKETLILNGQPQTHSLERPIGPMPNMDF